MAQDNVLSQAEIDAMLEGANQSQAAPTDEPKPPEDSISPSPLEATGGGANQEQYIPRVEPKAREVIVRDPLLQDALKKIDNLEKEIVATKRALKTIQDNLKGTPIYGIHEKFTCSSCGTTGMVAVHVTCTSCSKQKARG